MQEIKSISQFNQLKSNALLIIDFYATWCGPCKAISPGFEKLAKQHESSTSIIFAKVDVDKAKDVAQACGITAMPTFQFFQKGKKVDEVRGADVQQLTTKVGYYTAAAIKAGETKDSKNIAGGSKDTVPGSLRSLIDIEAAKMVNASNLSSVMNIAKPPPSGYAVASAAGSKLLIYLPFTQAVSPSHVKITVPQESISNAPSRIHIGTNLDPSDLDMSSLDKAENIQAFNVYSDEYANGTIDLKLKASKFTAIKSLTIRIDANLSGESSTVSKIGVIDVVGVKA